MGKKDKNYIFDNDGLFKKGNLLEYTSSEGSVIQLKEASRGEDNKGYEDFIKSCIKIIDGQNKYITKLEKDIDEASKYILYCRDKIDSIYSNGIGSETRTYYHSQIEKTEDIINDKKFKIEQTRKRISETENRIIRY